MGVATIFDKLRRRDVAEKCHTAPVCWRTKPTQKTLGALSALLVLRSSVHLDALGSLDTIFGQGGFVDLVMFCLGSEWKKEVNTHFPWEVRC